MTEVVFEELMEIARRCRRVILAGYGEPLTNPQCLPLLRRLDADGIDISMATNGLGITPEIGRQLASIGNLTLINVSIDSPDPDVYRRVRGGNVVRALSGLGNLMAAVDDRHRVVVSSVAMLDTFPTLPAFPALLASLGVTRFAVQAVMDYNDFARGQGLLDHAELRDVVGAIRSACETHGVALELSGADRSNADLSDPRYARDHYYGGEEWDERLTRQCHVPWDVPFIDKDGRVFACCYAASQNERQLGQLGASSFDDIWAGEAFQEFRRDIVDGASTPDVCRRCTVAPLGEHHFHAWRARIVDATVSVSRRQASVCVQVVNEGTRSWTVTDNVRVGTGAPRDANSPVAHGSWIAPNRPCTFKGEVVDPGEIATFEFIMARGSDNSAVTFELVVEGVCWLESSTFAVTPGRKSRGAVRRLLRRLQRTQCGPVSLARRASPRPARAILRQLCR
jgi:radical SAM protein with 4Fe4S-binding SPASM domain